MSDDKAWNEIDWISSLNPRLNDDEINIPNDDVFKQCRFRKAMQECAHYDINNKVLTFTIKVPKGRYQRHTSSHHISSPANHESSAVEDIHNNYDYYPFNIHPLTQSHATGANALFADPSLFYDGSVDGTGDMYGFRKPNVDRSEIDKMSNNEMYGADLSASDAFTLMHMIGANDPNNVRRRLYGEDNDYDYDEDGYTYNEYGIAEEEYTAIMDNGYDFTTKFEYGDMLGYALWAKDIMSVEEFECVNCEAEEVFNANAMDDNEMNSNANSDYATYGDYMYYFDEHSFDFSKDEDWESTNGDLSKCSAAIPGLHHKLCVDHDNGEYQIRFAAATNDEMDDTYYQLYGYDEYYYNNNQDELAWLQQYIEDSYNDMHALRRIAQQKRVSSDLMDVPSGYDEEEYGGSNKRRMLNYHSYNDADDGSSYYYTAQYADTQKLLGNLQDELGDFMLSFESNTDWDDITNINDLNDEFGDMLHATRKCKVYQMVQMCAIMHHDGMNKGTMTIHIKLGRHKYHRSPFHHSPMYQTMANEVRHPTHAFHYDLKVNHQPKHTLIPMHWLIDHNIMNVDHKEWNNPHHFKTTHHHTYNGHHIRRKCKGTLCLCQYVDNTYYGEHIHPCKPARKADRAETLGAVDLLNLVNVMDGFLAPIHVLHPSIPSDSTVNIMHHPLSSSAFRTLPYAHILYLRSMPHRNRFIHPFHTHIVQNPIGYRRRKYRIPWPKYRRFVALMPPNKPLWIPQWIWNELQHNMKQSLRSNAASMDVEDYYDYDQELEDYYEDLVNQRTHKKRRSDDGNYRDNGYYSSYDGNNDHDEDNHDDDDDDSESDYDSHQTYYSQRNNAIADYYSDTVQYYEDIDSIQRLQGTRRRLPFRRPTLRRKTSTHTRSKTPRTRSTTRGRFAVPSFKRTKAQTTTHQAGTKTNRFHTILRRNSKQTADPKTATQHPPKHTQAHVTPASPPVAPKTHVDKQPHASAIASTQHTQVTPPQTPHTSVHVAKSPPVIAAAPKAKPTASTQHTEAKQAASTQHTQAKPAASTQHTEAKPQTPHTPVQVAKSPPVVAAAPVTKPHPATDTQTAHNTQPQAVQTHAADTSIHANPSHVQHVQREAITEPEQNTQSNVPQIEHHPHLASLLQRATSTLQHAGGVAGIAQALGVDTQQIPAQVLQGVQQSLSKRSGVQLAPGALENVYNNAKESKASEQNGAPVTPQAQSEATVQTPVAPEAETKPQIDTKAKAVPITASTPKAVPVQPQTAAVEQLQQLLKLIQAQNAAAPAQSVPQTAAIPVQPQAVATVPQPQTVAALAQKTAAVESKAAIPAAQTEAVAVPLPEVQKTVVAPAEPKTEIVADKTQTEVTPVQPAKQQQVVPQTEPQTQTVVAPAKTQTAAVPSQVSSAYGVLGNYYYYGYDDEDEGDEEGIMDQWYDEHDDEWLVLDDTDDNDVIQEAFGLLDFEDDSIWDEIMMNIETLKGRPLAKKCMNIFGRTLCICEFMDWLNGKVIGGNTRHICYSPTHKSQAITPQILKVVHESHQKDKKIDVKKVRVRKMAKKKDEEMNDEILKEHHTKFINQLKELTQVMQKIRHHEVKSLPDRRPVWLPRYFWHWMHQFPHFHELHLSHRLPWIASAAYMNKEKLNEFSGSTGINNEYYADEDIFDDYDSDEYEIMNDEWMKDSESTVSESYARAELEYSEVLDVNEDYDQSVNDNVDYIRSDDGDINENDANEYGEKKSLHEYEEDVADAYEFEDDYNAYEFEDDYNAYSKEENYNSAVISQPDVNDDINPYWIFELIFLAFCAFGIVCGLVLVQKYEWIETIKEFNEKSKRHYGFNRVSVILDIEEFNSDDVELSIS